MSQNQSLRFKWPRQASDGAFYCQPLREHPDVSKSWDSSSKVGTEQPGYEFEPFHLHENKKWHLQCVLKFVAGATVTNAVVEVKTGKPKITEVEQFCNKLIAEN